MRSGVANIIVLSWRDMGVPLSRVWGHQRVVVVGNGAHDVCKDKLDCVQTCYPLLPGEDCGVSEVTRVRSLVATGTLVIVSNQICH